MDESNQILQKPKILIVDDETNIRKVLEAILQRDHDVIVVSNGASAIEQLTMISHIDLVITDWEMPEISGIDLIKWIQENVPKVKTILTSGKLYLLGKEQFPSRELIGANWYLAKPFTQEQLKETVSNVLTPK